MTNNSSQDENRGIKIGCFRLMSSSSLFTWLGRLNPLLASLGAPALLVFILTALWGANGGVFGLIMSPIISPVIFIALSTPSSVKWKRYSIAAAMSGTSLVISVVVSIITIALDNAAMALANSAYVSFYSPTVGAKSRRHANKVIAKITTFSSVDLLEKDINFLLSRNQSKWLTKSQLDALQRKTIAISAIRKQKEGDLGLESKVQEALTIPISLANYKNIITTATVAPTSPRFKIVISGSERLKLQERLLAAKKQGVVLELAKKKADEEKSRAADYIDYLARVTESRKKLSRIAVTETESKGIYWQTENDPVRLMIGQQIESELRPMIYDSAPHTLTPAQIDSIWLAIKKQIWANL